MIELPNELHGQLRTVFLHCSQFEDYRKLCGVFVTPELFPFRFGLPSADNTGDLVDKFLEYILDQNHIDKGPVLPIFLATLRERYEPVDARHRDLDYLYQKIQEAIHSQQPHQTFDPHLKSQLKNKLFEKLLELDFRPQIKMVRDVIDTQHIAAFIINGPPDYGQRVLTYRLSHLRLHWDTGRYITIEAGANGTGNSKRSLWREVAKRMDLPLDTDPSALAEKVCKWWQTQDVIFVIHTVDYIPTTILNTWLDEFWKPLVESARKCNYIEHANTHLIMFMVDYSGCVCKSEFNFVEQPEKIPDTYFPLHLPPATLFPETDLDFWIDAASEVLPKRIPVRVLLDATQNGTPELVYDEICRHCGISWEGEFAS